MTGANGEPDATRARPSVQRIRSSAVASDFEVGFESGKNNRPLDLSRHLANNWLRKSTTNRGETDQDCCLEVFDHIGQANVSVGKPGPFDYIDLRLGIDALFRTQVISAGM